jgi:hypothetical protein
MTQEIEEPTHFEMCEQLTVALGIDWHEKTFPECGVTNPTFSTSLEVLAAMKERLNEERFNAFIKFVNKPYSVGGFISINLLLTPDFMLKAAWEFMEGK